MTAAEEALQAMSKRLLHSETGQSEAGLRFDNGKERYDLLPPDGINELAKLYTIGARKYAERNWERGMKWSKCFSPMMRHAWKFWRGEIYDTETGIHHMIHVAWNALALFCYDNRQIGDDDRHLGSVYKGERESCVSSTTETHAPTSSDTPQNER